MQPFTLNQAAKACNKSKSTLLTAINNGRLSASRDGKNQWQIDPSELFRVYAARTPEPVDDRTTEPANRTPQNHQNNELIDSLKAQIESLKAQAERDREQIERERQQADNWRQQAVMLLEHHAPMQEINPTQQGDSLLWRKLFGRKTNG